MQRESFRASERKSSPGTAAPSAAQIEALVGALAGVAAVRAELLAARLIALYVVPRPGTSTKGLARNAQSALMAVLGITLDSHAVRLVSELPAVKTPAQPDTRPPAHAPASPRAPAMQPPLVNASTPVARPPAPDARWRAASVLARDDAPEPGAASPQGAPAWPRITSLELQRLPHDRLHCRVVLERNGAHHTGLAEAGDDGDTAVSLAARATLQALGRDHPCDWCFEGAADVIIGGQRHICVSVRRPEDGATRSGAAPVTDSVEHAVAHAVLNAASLDARPHIDDQRRVRQR